MGPPAPEQRLDRDRGQERRSGRRGRRRRLCRAETGSVGMASDADAQGRGRAGGARSLQNLKVALEGG